MLTVLYIILILLALLLGSLFLPWRIGLRGTVSGDKHKMEFGGAVTAGGRRTGIMFRFAPQSQLACGPYRHPWLIISLGGKKAPEKAPEPQPKKPAKRRRGPGATIDLVKKLIRAVVSEISWECCELHGTVGGIDPQTTGLIVGLAAWVKPWLPPAKTNLNLTPDFSAAAVTDVTGDLRFRLRPALLAISAGWVYIRNK